MEFWEVKKKKRSSNRIFFFFWSRAVCLSQRDMGSDPTMVPQALQHCPFLGLSFFICKMVLYLSEVYFLIAFSVSQSCYENQ